jgi:hypothetical protein
VSSCVSTVLKRSVISPSKHIIPKPRKVSSQPVVAGKPSLYPALDKKKKFEWRVLYNPHFSGFSNDLLLYIGCFILCPEALYTVYTYKQFQNVVVGLSERYSHITSFDHKSNYFFTCKFLHLKFKLVSDDLFKDHDFGPIEKCLYQILPDICSVMSGQRKFIKHKVTQQMLEDSDTVVLDCEELIARGSLLTPIATDLMHDSSFIILPIPENFLIQDLLTCSFSSFSSVSNDEDGDPTVFVEARLFLNFTLREYMFKNLFLNCSYSLSDFLADLSVLRFSGLQIVHDVTLI